MPSETKRCWRKSSVTVALLALALFTTSCGGALYKVKPAVELPPLPATSKTLNAGAVTVRVAPLMSDEESQDLFEANLPLSGILPIRIALEFESGVPVEIKKAKFHLRDEGGREWKAVSAKAAVSRILKANDVYAYNPNSRKQFEKEFVAYSIDLKAPLSTSDRNRQGFLFLQTPKQEPVETSQKLTLVIEGLPQRIEIPLN